MRLVCPNCDARYEVGSDAIPQSGRDVQCSNCGQTWFQDHPEPALPKAEIAPASESPQRRPLAEGVESVLREEGERERRARAAEATPVVESQPDLGLSEAPAAVAPAPARERTAQTRGPSTGAPEPQKHSNRRELLPDIDQINSSLRPNEERHSAEAAPPPVAIERAGKRKRGFRLGFGIALFAMAAAILLYRFAPDIIQRFPESKPYLTAYVEWANEARITLDKVVRDGSTWLRNLVDQATANSG